jgi:hypothetical protein
MGLQSVKLRREERGTAARYSRDRPEIAKAEQEHSQ